MLFPRKNYRHDENCLVHANITTSYTSKSRKLKVVSLNFPHFMYLTLKLSRILIITSIYWGLTVLHSRHWVKLPGP